MCSPDYFRVSYVINPWMEGNLSNTTTELSISQWEALRKNLSKVANLEFVEPVNGLPDLVFTANAGFVYADTCILSHFLFKERQGEEKYFNEWFDSKGFQVHKMPEDIAFEGAGDALIDRGQNIIWGGYGFRTDIRAFPIVSKITSIEILPLKLIDNRFYHLDTCLCPLEGGYLMYFPEAFDEDSIKLIEQNIPLDKRIIVNEKDAELFACNAVNIDKNIFLNEVSNELIKTLEKIGFKVTCSQLSEYIKAGGAAKCLTLKLDEPIK
jgi:N-dimethylarginine dimethylaminohydrolase